MRSLKAIFLAILSVAVAASPVPAQSAGTVELGGFGRYTWFDTLPVPGLKDDYGFGGRLGVFLGRTIALEGDVSRTRADGPLGTKVTFMPIHARLVLNAPLGPTALLLGAGYTRNKFSDGATGDEDGAGALAGLRIGLKTVSLRLEGTLDYMPKGTPSRKHWGAQAGLSLLFGGHRGVKDGDHDGVGDEVDQCLSTPEGEKVDGRGCSLPKDSDGDGVGDGADQCPNTAAGERVDAKGCPVAKDSDGDGVIDSADRCPVTPAGERVDANGCSLPKDSDHDGVLDTADRCPVTPAGERVDANGCSLPKDSDGDGVLDGVDRCPNTPAGAVVDATGCVPPKDSDGDGILDSADQCPGTPAGTQVDAKGCQVLFQVGKTALVLQGVNFATGRAVLLPASREILDRVAQSLRANEDVRVEVAGYTDSQGSRATNLRLSQARADAVVAYLIEQGVSASRLVAQGYGPDNAVASNATAAGRAQNRRVELHKAP